MQLNPPALDQAITSMAEAWPNKDPAAARKWVSALPPGPLRIEALQLAAPRLTKDDPVATLNLVGTVPDRDTRINLEREAAGEWRKVDREAAVIWIESSELGFDEKKAYLYGPGN